MQTFKEERNFILYLKINALILMIIGPRLMFRKIFTVSSS